MWQVFPPASAIFAGVGVLLSVCISMLTFAWAIVIQISQAARDIRASQDILTNMFERIEMGFRRLEIYTKVPATAEMTDIIIQIMAGMLSILGIATKQIKQSRISRYSPYKYSTVD